MPCRWLQPVPLDVVERAIAAEGDTVFGKAVIRGEQQATP